MPQRSYSTTNSFGSWQTTSVGKWLIASLAEGPYGGAAQPRSAHVTTDRPVVDSERQSLSARQEPVSHRMVSFQDFVPMKSEPIEANANHDCVTPLQEFATPAPCSWSCDQCGGNRDKIGQRCRQIIGLYREEARNMPGHYLCMDPDDRFYYFHPYAPADVVAQQRIATGWGEDPHNAYDNRRIERIAAETAARLGPGAVPAPMVRLSRDTADKPSMLSNGR
jgi:hypothetical protein